MPKTKDKPIHTENLIQQYQQLRGNLRTSKNEAVKDIMAHGSDNYTNYLRKAAEKLYVMENLQKDLILLISQLEKLLLSTSESKKHRALKLSASRTFRLIRGLITMISYMIKTNRNLQERLFAIEDATYNGYFIMVISEYEENKRKSADNHMPVTSEPFYSADFGYKMSCSVYLNGFEAESDAYLAVVVSVMEGEFDEILKWPFNKTINVEIVNQVDKDEGFTKELQQGPIERPRNGMAHGVGDKTFMEISSIEDPDNQYLINDSLVLRVKISDQVSKCICL